jgi:general secretion pathway protein G
LSRTPGNNSAIQPARYVLWPQNTGKRLQILKFTGISAKYRPPRTIVRKKTAAPAHILFRLWARDLHKHRFIVGRPDATAREKGDRRPNNPSSVEIIPDNLTFEALYLPDKAKPTIHRRQNMKLKNQAGFTLIEVIVIAAILAILAGVLVPMVFSQIDQAKEARAEADCKSISSAMLTFRKDLGVWPNLSGVGCGENTELLRGEGNLPGELAAMAFQTANVINFSDVLMDDSEECYNETMFKGPYLPVVTADPWGNAYLLAANNLATASTNPAFVFSAGPNGIMETPIFSVSALGDDIGIRVK